jgi:hypothetical protein
MNFLNYPARAWSANCTWRRFSRTTKMVCSNAKSGKLFVGSERLRRTATLLLLAFSLSAGSARAQCADQELFATPTNDVECTYRPSPDPELSCERFGSRHLRFVLGPTGHAHMFSVPTDEECCSTENVLEPGMTWSQGSFICHYGRNGLTCKRDRHGFHIGKKVVMAY